jgi:hypothetical protein
MGRGATKTGIRQRCISWGVMFSLAAYFLNLCTLSPQVHAASTGRLSSGQQASAEHCAQSRGATQHLAPGVADHEQKGDPFCCDLRSEHNKVIPSFLILADFLPVVAYLFLPSFTTLVNGGVQLLHSMHALHSSHPPPLYVILCALLF